MATLVYGERSRKKLTLNVNVWVNEKPDYYYNSVKLIDHILRFKSNPLKKKVRKVN